MVHWFAKLVRHGRCVRPDRFGRHHAQLAVGKMTSGAAGLGGLLLVILMAAVEPSFTRAWADGSAPQDSLMDLSLDQLMDLQVTSVSKRPEKLADAAAAVFVITNDDIRRAGALNLAEVLRMVPGLQVGRVDNNRWGVTARGFDGVFANKLLVLVDGRSVYTPTFSGVYWEIQDVPLHDIDRIEVIRGPGASLWGVNAVNGVINVITKRADATQGLYLESVGGAGELDRSGTVRYGGRMGPDVSFRIYGKMQGFGTSGSLWQGVGATNQRGVSQFISDARDDWSVSKAGFRMDAALSDVDNLTFQGDLYDGKVGTAYSLPEFEPPYDVTAFDRTDVSGGNLLARFGRRFGKNANDLQVQVYYDRTQRLDILYGEASNTLDLDLQQCFQAAPWCHFLAGAEYRYVDLTLTETGYLSASHPRQQLRFYSGFSQADLGFWQDRLAITVGAKLEETPYVTAQFQPNVRVRWQLAESHSIWGAVSRAMRTPSSLEAGVSLWIYTVPPFSLFNDGPTTIAAEIRGTEDFGSETMTAMEAGYRTTIGRAAAIDVAAFRNEYRDLVVNVWGSPEAVSESAVRVPLLFTNGLKATTSGVEVASDWQPLSGLRFKGAYTYLDMDLSAQITTGQIKDIVHPFAGGHLPRHQLSARGQITLSRIVDADAWLRSVDELSALAIPGYTELDLRVEWRPVRRVAIAAVGRNLLHDEHREFTSELTGLTTGIARSGYVSISVGL